MYWNYGGYGSVSSILSKLQEIKGKIKHDLQSHARASKARDSFNDFAVVAVIYDLVQ